MTLQKLAEAKQWQNGSPTPNVADVFVLKNLWANQRSAKQPCPIIPIYCQVGHSHQSTIAMCRI
jgi:hypothetical protein